MIALLRRLGSGGRPTRTVPDAPARSWISGSSAPPRRTCAPRRRVATRGRVFVKRRSPIAPPPAEFHPGVRVEVVLIDRTVVVEAEQIIGGCAQLDELRHRRVTISKMYRASSTTSTRRSHRPDRAEGESLKLREHAQVAVARMSMFIRPHDRHRAEATTNSDICPRAATAAAACCRLSPVWIARQLSQNARPTLLRRNRSDDVSDSLRSIMAPHLLIGSGGTFNAFRDEERDGRGW